MQTSFNTPRLVLEGLTTEDAAFILELVNTAGWLRFIGERNIKTVEAAQEYALKIITNPDVSYWVVKIPDQRLPVGVITLIKRDYLDHSDIGFAFLDRYAGQGYALEAASVVLQAALQEENSPCILATTIPDNEKSIRLLEKLGLRFLKEIHREDELLCVYSITKEKYLIDHLIGKFFSLFTNKNSVLVDLNIMHTLCIPEALLIKKTGLTETVYSIHSFIEPRKKILSDGTLTEFEECESDDETKIDGHIAQRFSKYKKNGKLNGVSFQEYGTKIFQFLKTPDGWKISAVIWEDQEAL